MAEIMNDDAKFLRTEDDEEKRTQQFEHYHYLGMPVAGLLRNLLADPSPPRRIPSREG